LRELSLLGDAITDAGVVHLKGLQNLTSLSLECAIVTDSSVRTIGGMKNLVDLELSGTRVTDDGLVRLGNLKSLERLHLSGCTAITDAGVGGLKILPSLRELYLRDTPQISSEATSDLAQAIPGLKVYR
jgi:internalin A